MSKLADILGDGSHLGCASELPWQPRDGGCACCRHPLAYGSGAFCPTCADHPLGVWCAPMMRKRMVWDAAKHTYQEVKRYETLVTRYPDGGIAAGREAETATATAREAVTDVQQR